MKEKRIIEDITQAFYNNLSSQYDKFYLDWQTAVQKEAVFLSEIFKRNGFDSSARILDCACGIGTQAIGLAAQGYRVTASDISDAALAEARKRAVQSGVRIRFAHADFRALADTFSEQFDLVIAMDNALPHMLTHSDLEAAAGSIAGRLRPGGMFTASIRDYDILLQTRLPYSPPYIHETDRYIVRIEGRADGIINESANKPRQPELMQNPFEFISLTT